MKFIKKLKAILIASAALFVVGAQAAQFDPVTASQGSQPGFVRISWSAPTVACPSAYGCGILVKRNGTVIYGSIINTNGAVWNMPASMSFDDYNYGGSTTYTYTVEGFQDTYSGAGTVRGSTIGISSSVTGYAGEIITNLKATSLPGAVKLSWSPAGWSCTQRFGCGYIVLKDNEVAFISTINVDGYTVDPITELTIPVSDTLMHTFMILGFPDGQSGAGTQIAGYVGTEVKVEGSALSSFDNFAATDGTKPGYVRLSWNPIEMPCPSADGCGYELERDGVKIFQSVGNGVPVGYVFGSKGNVWTGANSYDDFVTDTATHTYKIKAFSLNRNGNLPTFNVSYIGTIETETGYAGETLKGFTASKGTEKGAVVLRSEGADKSLVCNSNYGCGYEYLRDGVVIYQTLSPTSTTATGKLWVGSTLFVDYLADTKEHQYTARLYSKTALSSTSFRLDTVGVSAYDNGWAGPIITDFAATKGEFPTSVKMSWRSVGCGTNNGCGIQIKRDGTVIKTSVVGTKGYGFVEGTTFVQGGTYEDSPGPGVHEYVISSYWANSSGGIDKFVGEAQIDTGFTSGTSFSITNFSASDGTDEGVVRLTWDEQANVDEFEIFEKVGGVTTKIATVSGGQSSYARLVDDITVRQYFVKAFKNGSEVGTGSITDTGYGKTAFSSFVASDGLYFRKIKVDWNEVPEATKYELYKLVGNNWSLVYSGTELSYEDTVDGTDRRIYQIRAVKDGIYFGGVSKPEGGYARSSVENVDASDGLFPGKIVVSWDPIDGVTRYAVVRDGSIIEKTSNTTYTDTLVTDLKQHAYSIRALDGSDVQIGSDSGINYGYAGPVFIKFNASKGTLTGGVLLEWNAVEGAANYAVYRNGSLITKTTSTEYTNVISSGTSKYSYYVVALRSNGAQIGSQSKVEMGFAGSGDPTPKNLRATNQSSFDKIILTWDAVKFCTTSPCDYTVESPNANNQVLQNFKIWRDGEELAVVSGSATSYEDVGPTVQGGKSFTYWVEALDTANKVINVRSGVATGSTLSDLDAPKNLIASDGEKGKINLFWNRVLNASGYAIFRDGVQIATVNSLAKSFVDTDVEEGRVYSYQVAAMSGERVFSKSTADNGYALISAVLNLSATQGTVTEQIVIKWEAKKGATSYRITRDGLFVKTLNASSGFDAEGNTYSWSDGDVDDVDNHGYTVEPKMGSIAGEVSSTVYGYMNLPPTEANAKGSVMTGGSVLMTPTIVDPNKNEEFTLKIGNQPENGTASISNGKILYKPNSYFSGTETFSFIVTDKGNEDFLGTASVQVNCAAPTINISELSPANLKEYGAGRFDVKVEAGGCISTYKVTYEFQKRISGEWTKVTGGEFSSVAGGTSKSITFDSMQSDSYQLMVTASDLVSNIEPVIKFVSFDIKKYALPTISLNRTVAIQSTETVIGSIVEPEPKDCTFTTSGAVMNENPFTHCLIQWLDLPEGLVISDDKLKVSGAIDSIGLQKITAHISIYSPIQGKKFLGKASANVEVTALTDMKFSAPETMDAVQFLTKSTFAVNKGAPNTCEVTTDVESAMNSYGDNKFRCLLEMPDLPASLAKTNTGFTGNFTSVGTTNINWNVYYFKKGTEKILVKSGTVAVNVTSAEIDYELERFEGNPLQLISNINLGMRKTGKNTCSLTVTEDEESRGKCVVEWISLPEGIEQNPENNGPQLKGAFNKKGTNTVKYRLSFIDTMGGKTLINEKEAIFEVEEAPRPSISFSDGNIIADDILGYPKGGGIASRLVIDGTRSAVDGEVSFTQNASNDFRLSVQSGKRSRVILVRAAPLWSEQSATVKLWLQGNNTLSEAKTVTLVSIPDLKVRPELMIVEPTVSDDGPAKIKMRIGEYRKGGFVYAPSEMGQWKLRLMSRINGVFEPVSELVDVNEAGEAEVLLPVQGLSIARLMVEANVTSPSNPRVVVKRMSRYRDIRIVKGKPIDGKLTIKSDRPSAGAAPFNVRFEIKLDGKADVAALGAFNLEISKDGSDWIANEDRRCKLICSMTFYQGRYQVRAHFVNKNSGAESYSEPLDIYSYDAIKVTMEGANVYYPKDQVEVSLKTLNALGGDIASNIEWSVTPSSSRDPQGEIASGTGDKISFTYNKSGTLYLTAKAVRADIDDPTVKDYVVSKFPILFKAIRKPRVIVIGPKVAETDVVQTFNAQIISDFDGTNTKLKTTGEWTLPDGQKIPGNVLNWVPDEGDKQFLNLGKVNLTYSAWVEGYKEETLTSIVRPIGLWTYVWPEFTLKATLTKNIAPAAATLVVTPDDTEAFSNIEPKDITYTWNIDPELILNRVSGGSAKLTIPMGGSFMAGVTVSDKRGHSTTLEVPLSSYDMSDIFVKLNVANASKHTHSPLDLSVNIQVTGGAVGDYVKEIVYDLDGTVLDFDNKSFGKVLGITTGNHNLNVKVTTLYGKVGTQTANFDVLDNVPPTCELKVTPIDNRDSYLEAACNDPDGRIYSYEWNVDNINLGAKSFRWRYRKPTDKANIPISVNITDSGNAKVRINGVVP